MSQELNKILMYDDDIKKLLLSNNQLKIKEIVSKIEKILNKLNNIEILYLLKNNYYLHDYIDVCLYLKKYKINKKEIKENNSYKEELINLNNFISYVSDCSINEEEYMYICNKCEVDNIANYLLSNMSNLEIMELSNESNDWNYKLFLYGNLKS